jgi:hypothetical protein
MALLESPETTVRFGPGEDPFGCASVRKQLPDEQVYVTRHGIVDPEGAPPQDALWT